VFPRFIFKPECVTGAWVIVGYGFLASNQIRYYVLRERLPDPIRDLQFAYLVPIYKFRVRKMWFANMVGLQTMCKPTIQVFANRNLLVCKESVCISVCKEWNRISHPRKRTNVVLLEVDAVSPYAEIFPMISIFPINISTNN
jgi:hypothetical protein